MNKDRPHPMEALARLMAHLRSPRGCPWDRAQDWTTLVPYTIEEAYEVALAAETGDVSALKDELGDLLFHVVFYSQIAEEAGQFTLEEVITDIVAKMTRRHPHVFGDLKADTPLEVVDRWEEVKRGEALAAGTVSHLDGVNEKMPALLWAYKVQQKMAKVGFDWANAPEVLEKVVEEAQELTQAWTAEEEKNMEEEFGDLLFTLVNLGRHLKINPEAALRRSTRKFKGRFHYMEARLRQEGRLLAETPLAQLDALWEESKEEEDP